MNPYFNDTICIKCSIHLLDQKCFELVQYIFNAFKYFWPWSNMGFYYINWPIWTCSKIFDCIQKYLTWSKTFSMNRNIEQKSATTYLKMPNWTWWHRPSLFTCPLANNRSLTRSHSKRFKRFANSVYLLLS